MRRRPSQMSMKEAMAAIASKRYIPRTKVMEGKVSGFMGRQGGKASVRRKPTGKPKDMRIKIKTPSVIMRSPSVGAREGRIGGIDAPRRVGVGREQAKIEPAGLSAAISAIVNNIMSMIFGRR